MNKKAIVGVALVGVSALLASCSGGSKQNMAALIQARDHKPITVEEKDIELTTQYSATIRGRQDIDVYPQVGGTLQQLLVTEGQRVKKGQTLFVIDQVPYKAAVAAAEAALSAAEAGVEQAMAGLEAAQAGQTQALAGREAAQATMQSAQASLATAQLNYDSRKSLYEQNVVSQFDLQSAANALQNAKAVVAQANAQLSQANGAVAASKAQISQCEAQIQSGKANIEQCKAQLLSAHNNLSYTVVKSPADGVVGELPYRVGTLVSAQMPKPLTTVSDNNSMFVYFTMNENELLSLIREYGSEAEAINNLPSVSLTLSDGSKYGYEGRVESVSGVINQSTGTSQLRAVFPNPEHMLHSGNTGNVNMPTAHKSVIVIPQEATVKQQDRYIVYKVEGNIARPRQVEVELENDGTHYIVKNGLQAGDKIIGTGVGLLRGDSININAATEAKEALGVKK